jgi:hypothetical protein
VTAGKKQMKIHDRTTVSWQFDQLFPGNQFVFGEFSNPAKAKKTQICIGEVLIYNPLPIPGDPRQLRLIVRESQFGDRAMKLHHLPCTLARAEDKGAIPRGSHFGCWLLKKMRDDVGDSYRVHLLQLIGSH